MSAAAMEDPQDWWDAGVQDPDVSWGPEEVAAMFDVPLGLVQPVVVPEPAEPVVRMVPWPECEDLEPVVVPETGEHAALVALQDAVNTALELVAELDAEYERLVAAVADVDARRMTALVRLSESKAGLATVENAVHG